MTRAHDFDAYFAQIDADIREGYQCPCPKCMRQIGVFTGCFGDAKPHVHTRARPATRPTLGARQR